MMNEMDGFVNDLVDYMNDVILEHAIKPRKVHVPGKQKQGYAYVMTSGGDWYRTKDFHAEIPIWKKVRLEPQKLDKNERHRRRYLRMMQRGRIGQGRHS